MVATLPLPDQPVTQSQSDEYVIVTPAVRSNQNLVGWTPEPEGNETSRETTVKPLDYDVAFSPRNGHSAVTVRNTVYIFGGQCGDGSLRSDMWKLVERKVWRKIEVDDPKPCARYFHKTVVNPVDGKVWLYGGFGENRRFLNDVWLFDATTGIWEEVATTGDIPEGRALHSCAIDRNNLIVFGGLERGGNPSAAVWSLDLSTKTWTEQRPEPPTDGCDGPQAPQPRYAHHSALHEGHWYVTGGYSSIPSCERRKIEDLWRYSLEEKSWLKISDTFADGLHGRAPLNIHRATSICVKDSWLFVGSGSIVPSYCLANGVWTFWNLAMELPDLCRHAISVLPAPATRSQFDTRVSTMVVTGGLIDRASINSTYLIFRRSVIPQRSSPFSQPSPYLQLRRSSLGPNFCVTSPATSRLMVPRSGDSTIESMSACSDQLQGDRENEIADVLDDLLQRVEQLTTVNDEMEKRHREMEAEYDQLISRNQELTALVEKWNCSVCLDNEVATMFMPCKHMRLCSRCAASVFGRPRPKCPDCREPVVGIIQPFLP